MTKDRLVIFVCTGNTCRSPMAEAIFLTKAAAHPEWRALSAGIAAAEGYSASPETVHALKQRGIVLPNHRSKQLTERMLNDATDVFVMTFAHRDVLLANFPEHADKTRLVTEYSGRGNIDDPIGFDQDVYDRTADQLDEAIDAIIEHWEKEEETSSL